MLSASYIRKRLDSVKVSVENRKTNRNCSCKMANECLDGDDGCDFKVRTELPQVVHFGALHNTAAISGMR